ncbi:Ig-like domain repeat protein [Conexibacter sp. DBS9H8]|uniref:Ig-like domain repeat protein n=1 Tax=Conexibacter sp. DBS9H8 TaxID=2937801 RepID=UPI00200D94A6|nr:Ig-like domain repeat protein [Conexibacter sp. DBS9H8]
MRSSALCRRTGVFGVSLLLTVLVAAVMASSALAAECGTGTLSGKTCTYTTAGQNQFTVPAGVTEITVTAVGGAGDGGGPGAAGGRGATVTADLPVSAGTTYYTEVGAAGATAGAGGTASDVQTCSDIASGCTDTGIVGSDPRLLVAAGGGGGGGGTSTVAGGPGGNAGTGTTGSTSGIGGVGSSTTTAGAEGGSADYTSSTGSAPTDCTGGTPGSATTGGAGETGTEAGGGGGGGWFGGDGGCSGTDAGGGGGAGLSYVESSATGINVSAPAATPEVVVTFLDPTSTQISCAPAVVPVGSSASCSVYVVDNASSPTSPTGTVSFSSTGLGSFSSSSCTLTASQNVAGYCTVTYTPSSFNPGSVQTLYASYGGDTAHSTSEGSTTVSTSLHPTATAVSCSPTSVTVSGGSTCTATVRDTSSSGVSTPTGNVSFSSNSPGAFSPTSACTLTSTSTFGTASCSVTYTPSAIGSGTHTITAAYVGDSSHAASSSTTTVTVSGHPSTAALSCANPSGQLGVPITCTVTVSDSAGVTPAGTVTFASTLAGSFAPAGGCGLTGTATAGQAACSVTFTPTALGNGTISAAYPGESVLAPSRAATTISVAAVATNVAVPAASKRFLAAGQRVTFTTTVSAAAGSAQVSGGTVTFHLLDGERLCVATVGAGGSASCATSALRVGISRVVATYSGATGFVAATSGPRVEKAFPGITIIIRSPRRNGTYRRGQFVRVVYICRATVGLARRRGCVATQRDHQRLNTRTLGRHVFRVTVTTRAGVRRTVTVVYRVTAPRG